MEVSGQLHTLAKEPPVPNEQEAGWTPEPIWMWWQREIKFLLCPCQDFNLSYRAHNLVTILAGLPWLLSAAVRGVLQ